MIESPESARHLLVSFAGFFVDLLERGCPRLDDAAELLFDGLPGSPDTTPFKLDRVALNIDVPELVRVDRRIIEFEALFCHEMAIPAPFINIEPDTDRFFGSHVYKTRIDPCSSENSNDAGCHGIDEHFGYRVPFKQRFDLHVERHFLE